MYDNNQNTNQSANAAKLLRIARGLATGGIKGALVETALSFAPQLIKAAIVIISILIFLPYLIIAAVPNFMFQFNSSASHDVKEMSEKAKIIESAYKSTQDYKKKEVESIISQIQGDYDEVEIETGDNLNHYWFIAITSVAYEQDLFAMNADSVKLGIIDNLKLLLTESTQEITDGDTIKTLKKLKVSVSDLDPEELMEKLDFTDAQKNWARVIYRTMADDQTIRPGDMDYVGGNYVDYGDIHFSDGATDVVYYNQADSRWGGKLYGKYDTIAVAGCGPTSLAMVVSSLTNRTILPDEMSDWAYANGYRCEGAGSYHSLIPEGGRHFGLKVEGASASEGQKIVDALSSGKLVIAIMGPGNFTTGGHFLVLRGVTSEGKILVADSGSYNRTNQEWSLRTILSEARRGAAAGGPFWILGL